MHWCYISISRVISVLTLLLTLRQLLKDVQSFILMVLEVYNGIKSHTYTAQQSNHDTRVNWYTHCDYQPKRSKQIPTLHPNLGIKVTRLKRHQSRWEEVMMYLLLNLGLRVVDRSSWKAALGQFVFQAQIDLGIMSLLYISTLFGKQRNIWTERGSLRYFRVKGHRAERFKCISTIYSFLLFLMLSSFITTTVKMWAINTLCNLVL